MDVEEQKYRKAKSMVNKLKGFYIHAFVFTVVNLGLFLLNILVSPERIWFFWSLGGWSIGLLAHGIVTYGITPFSAQWENRKMKEFMDRLDKEEIQK
ncbi:2TM domain-containing protein [Mesobacillus foraminis]|uniref:2TM domain-containing protein n=1 Tax=Mesobacillus foraminis TaxID=279826 RepID=UPI00399F86D5